MAGDPWRRISALPRRIPGIDHGLGYAALRERLDRRQRRLLDRCEDRRERSRRSGRRPAFLSAIQSRLSVSALTLPAKAIAALRKLEGTIDEKRMIRLNAEAERTKNYARAADLYFQDGDRQPIRDRRIVHAQTYPLDLAPSRARRHSRCCFQSSSAFRSASPPAGAARSATRFSASPAWCKRFHRSRCSPCSCPLPFFGISARTAIAALFLYGLLPIVRNTATGLQDIAPADSRIGHCAWPRTVARDCEKFICRSRRARSSPE